MTGSVPPSPGLASVSATTLATSSNTETAGAAAAAAAAAWRLQQRLEFIQFEERIKRVSHEDPRMPCGGNAGTAAAATAAFEGLSRGAMAAGGTGDVGLSSENSDGRGATTAAVPAQVDVGSGGGNAPRGAMLHRGAVGLDSASVAAAAAGAAAKRLVVVLAEYLENKTTIGMVIVDQPGTGLTTAMLGFLEWYCRGEAVGGRQVSVEGVSEGVASVC